MFWCKRFNPTVKSFAPDFQWERLNNNMTTLCSVSSSVKDFYVKEHQLYYIYTASSGVKDLAWLTLHISASVKDWMSTLLHSILFLCQGQWKANKSKIFHFTWGLASMHWGWQSLWPMYISSLKKKRRRRKKREEKKEMWNTIKKTFVDFAKLRLVTGQPSQRVGNK